MKAAKGDAKATKAWFKLSQKGSHFSKAKPRRATSSSMSPAAPWRNDDDGAHQAESNAR